MRDVENLIKSVADGLKSMAQGLEAIADRVEALSSTPVAPKAPKAPKKTKAAGAKPKTKRAPKKKVVKAGKQTASDTVYQIIARSRKGINTSQLMKRTDFNEKKIHNIVYKLKKQGKIKAEKKGLYIKA